MSNEEEKRCPLCAEEMDWTDQQFMPCKCGYQVMLCSTYNVLFVCSLSDNQLTLCAALCWLLLFSLLEEMLLISINEM